MRAVKPLSKGSKMNTNFAKLIVITSFLIANCAFADTVEKRYELPNHGTLLLNVPDKWIDQVRRPPGDLPPTIRFTQKEDEQFVILFTPMWKTSRAQPGFGTAQSIKTLVAESAAETSSQALEKRYR